MVPTVRRLKSGFPIFGYQVAITQQAGKDERAIELRLTANGKGAQR